MGNHGPLSLWSERWLQAARTERRTSEALREWSWRRGETLDSLDGRHRAQAREACLQALQEGDKLHLLAGSPVGAATLHGSVEEVRGVASMLEFSEGRYEEGLLGQEIDKAHLLSQASVRLHEQAWLDNQSQSSNAEALAQAWFDAHRGSLMVPRRYHAAHLFLSAHEKDKPERQRELEVIAQQLQNGVTFDALAAAYSEDERTKQRGGDLGWFSASRMPEDFMLALASIQPGQISGVVRTKLGWHLIKLIEVKSEIPVSFDSVRAEIVAMLANQERAQSVRSVLTR